MYRSWDVGDSSRYIYFSPCLRTAPKAPPGCPHLPPDTGSQGSICTKHAATFPFVLLIAWEMRGSSPSTTATSGLPHQATMICCYRGFRVSCLSGRNSFWPQQDWAESFGCANDSVWVHVLGKGSRGEVSIFPVLLDCTCGAGSAGSVQLLPVVFGLARGHRGTTWPPWLEKHLFLVLFWQR